MDCGCGREARRSGSEGEGDGSAKGGAVGADSLMEKGKGGSRYWIIQHEQRLGRFCSLQYFHVYCNADASQLQRRLDGAMTVSSSEVKGHLMVTM